MNLHHRSTTVAPCPEVPHTSAGRLQGVWLVFARSAWVAVCVLAIGLFAASLPSYLAYLHLPAPSSYAAPQLTPGDLHTLQRLGLSLNFYAWLDIGVYVILLFVYVLVGVVLFWRKSDDRVALLASLSLVLFPVAFSSSLVGTLPAVWALPAEMVEFLGNCCLGLFFFVFPSGRFVPRWAGLLMVVWIAYWGVSIFFPLSPLANSLLFVFPLPGITLCLIVLQIYRYRRVSTPLQRQQTKWVIAGFAFSFGPLVIALTLDFLLLAPLFPTSSLVVTLVQWPFDLLLLLFPFSLGFAILRYRLWEIDTLINLTLVYGLLTGLLVAIYLGLTIGLESLVGLLTRQTSQPVSVVLSTLIIFVLFQPLRRRIQALIDRRFYRSKYDAARTLEAFSATLRNEVDLEQLSKHLLAVVQETTQPMHVSLWLRSPALHGIQKIPPRATPESQVTWSGESVKD